MPNKLNKQKQGDILSFYGIIISLFGHNNIEFVKNADSIKLLWLWIVIPILFKFVWRQSEFAFYVRQLRLAHFFILRKSRKVICVVRCSFIVPQNMIKG